MTSVQFVPDVERYAKVIIIILSPKIVSFLHHLASEIGCFLPAHLSFNAVHDFLHQFQREPDVNGFLNSSFNPTLLLRWYSRGRDHRQDLRVDQIECYQSLMTFL